MLLESDEIGKGMKEKIYACLLAVKNLISVRIADGRIENAIMHAINGNP